jgi:hypothetical protein
MLALLAATAVVLVALGSWRWLDIRTDRTAWRRLVSLQPAEVPVFDASMTAALPQPAQRFFRFAIAPGTPLHTVAEIAMEGEFSLGNKDKPDYMPMENRNFNGSF